MFGTRMAPSTPIVVVAVVVAMGCSSSATWRSSAGANHFAGSTNDVIAAAELSRIAPGHSAMDAVEQARPWFLHPRGMVSTASIDGSPPADASVLRTIPITDIKEIRLVRDGSRPALRPDGTVVVGDVILVTTRRGPE